jgi:predicted Zn-dependent protease
VASRICNYTPTGVRDFTAAYGARLRSRADNHVIEIYQGQQLFKFFFILKYCSLTLSSQNGKLLSSFNVHKRRCEM